jgi:hypothetical protein
MAKAKKFYYYIVAFRCHDLKKSRLADLNKSSKRLKDFQKEMIAIISY